jgi:hypothetical protein
MKKTVLVFVFIVFFISSALASQDIMGFDGLEWGSDQSTISGKKKEMYGGRVVVIQTKNTPKFLGATVGRKLFCFDKKTGLCAGRISLLLGAGRSNLTSESLIDVIQALIGSKYGLPNSSNRISQSEWRSKSGGITIFRDSHQYMGERVSTLEIKYFNNRYLDIVSEHDQDVAQNIMKANSFKAFTP